MKIIGHEDNVIYNLANVVDGELLQTYLSTSKLSKLSKKACLIHQAGALSLLSLA
jgi:hypothetical protein